MENEKKNIVLGEDGSYFDGGYWAYIGYNIAIAFVTSMTFGIAYPWMRCWYQKWLSEHTVINGKRMTFNGTGGELFGKYIIWLLLTWVTCGIYGFWLKVALKKWITEHSNFQGEPDNNSFFDGTVGDFVITSILSALAAFVPFVGLSWSRIIMTRWYVGHTVIDSRRLTFRGGIGDLFLKSLLWGILTSITCGIFGLFVPVKYIKWETSNTFDENGTPEALTAKENYKVQIHTDAVMLKSGDAAQIKAIRDEMLNDANAGCEEQNLEKLNNALRFADILKDCGEEFTEEENALIYNCEILARKLKAEKPDSTKSKKGIVVVAIIAAVILFGGVIGTILALVVGAPIFAIFATRADGRPAMSQNVNVSFESFYDTFEDIALDNNYGVSEIASGVNERAYAISAGNSDDYIELYVADDGYLVDEIIISGDLSDENNIRDIVRFVYRALGLGSEYNISPDVSQESSINYGPWSFVTTKDGNYVSIKIT